MRRTGIARTALVLALAATGVVTAQVADTVTASQASAAPAQAHPLLPASRLQGEALLRFWGLRIYQARLWLAPEARPNNWSEHPLALELAYLRDLKGRAIAERSIEEMRRGGTFTEAQAQSWLTQMQALFPDVASGDRLTGIYLPGQGARFAFNGRIVGQIDDPQFARLFFGIWLAPTTSEPEMRLSLLGLAANPSR